MKPGDLYQHFKGHLYEIVCYAHDSEDPTRELVVYRLRLTQEGHGRTLFVSDAEENTPRWLAASGVPSPRDRTWVRAMTMFHEHVERDDYSGPRFRPVQLKPINICWRCGHTAKEHVDENDNDIGSPHWVSGCVNGCKCRSFNPEQEVVAA